MKLLFNNNNEGQSEIKATLGFLDGNFTYANIEPDIKLNTPFLIDLISQAVYDKLEAQYSGAGTDETIAQAITYCQIYILSMAYLDFASNNDLSHTNSGRSFRNEENEKLPWEWQLLKDEASMARRAYKALDLLFILLDGSSWAEWTSSEAYKKANALFIKNTNAFDDAFPINKSGQLYYRLVPFMADFEDNDIIPIITQPKADELKAAATPNANQKKLLVLIQKALAYLALGKALKAFPVEMIPSGIIYNENTRMKSEARAEVMQFFNNEGKNYLTRLEHEYQSQNATFETLKTTNGLEEGKKYVNL